MTTNCEKFQRRLILQAAGELPQQERAQLEQHLAACKECRAYQAELKTLMQTARQHLPTGAPKPQTVARITRAAQTQTRRRARFAAAASSRTLRWLPFVAAIFLIGLGCGYFIFQHPAQNQNDAGIYAEESVPAAAHQEQTSDFFADDPGVPEMLFEPVVLPALTPLDHDLLLLDGWPI